MSARESVARRAITSAVGRLAYPPGRRLWIWLRSGAAVAILALLVWYAGTGPFLRGIRGVGPLTLSLAVLIGAATTVAAAWRWRLIAAGLGIALPLRHAIAASYRAQFLNATLPGGIAGDVHRAVRHGVDIDDLGRATRAVAVERVTAATVQIVVAVLVLSIFPVLVPPWLPVSLVGVAAVGLLLLGAVVVPRARRRRRAADRWGWPPRFGTWIIIVLISTVLVAGYLLTFLIAARTAGVTAPLSQLIALTQLALLAMMVPVSVGGWGPREGVSAWAFAAAGLTTTQGVAVAVTYGVLTLAAALPGAAVVVANRLGGPARATDETPASVAASMVSATPASVPAATGGGVHG